MTGAMSIAGQDDSRLRHMITPEGLSVPLMLASRSSRFGALVLDLAMIVALMIALTLMLVWMAGGAGALDPSLAASQATRHALEFLAIVWIAAMFLFRNAWFLWFELGPRGATPGKRLTGIRIAARNGGRLSAEMVIARNLLRDIELFLPLVFLLGASDGGDMDIAGFAAGAWFLIFALMPCFNRDRLRAGDMIAGTWVVDAPRRSLEQALSSMESASGNSAMTGASYRFGASELAAYGEQELQMLERVLREDRIDALVAVHQAICRKIGREPGTGDERAFLEAYYTQLRARLEAGMRMGIRKADKHA